MSINFLKQKVFTNFLIFSLFSLTACQNAVDPNVSIPPVKTQPKVTEKKLPKVPFEEKHDKSFEQVPELVQEDQHVEKAINHPNCLAQCPLKAANDNILVDHDVIILSHNIYTKFADWVAYKVNVDYIKGPSRPRNWKKDPQLNDQVTFIPSDYKGLSQAPYLYDRGHQAPLAAFKNHPKWYVVNYLSNITPQKKYLNQGAWNKLEAQERRLVQQNNTQVYILTGPYYDPTEPMPKLEHTRISYKIPSGYWKIISTQKKNTIETVGFIFNQNVKMTAHYCDHIRSTSDIEKISGLKFFNDNFIFKENALSEKIGCKKRS